MEFSYVFAHVELPWKTFSVEPWSVSYGIPWSLHEMFHMFRPTRNSMEYKTGTSVFMKIP